MSFFKNILYIVLITLFILFTLFWVVISFIWPTNTFLGDLFAASYGIIALYGGVLGLVVARQWGGFKSSLGKSLLCFSVGLLSQEFGQVVYSYYLSYLHTSVPYPSIGDLGFFGSIPLYLSGTYYVLCALRLRFIYFSLSTKIISICTPLVLLFGSHLFFLRGYEFDWVSPLTIFLDFGYPLGQAAYISFAILTYFLSFKKLGGILKTNFMLLLFALLCQYLADYVFLYQASRDIWVISGINDYMYLVAYSIMTWAIIQLHKSLLFIKQDSSLKVPIVSIRNIDLIDKSILLKAASKIILEQKQIIGSLSWDIAKKVDGLTSVNEETIFFTKNPATSFIDLISQYTKLFGDTSFDVIRGILLDFNISLEHIKATTSMLKEIGIPEDSH